MLDHAAIAIAVSEAVTNAVMHAYRDREPGAVRILASFGDGAFIIVVSDDGLGMTPRTDSRGMGVGLVLIAQLSTLLEIDGDGKGTRLTMSFARAGERSSGQVADGRSHGGASVCSKACRWSPGARTGGT